MSNNTFNFTIAVPLVSETAKEWCERTLELASNSEDGELPDDIKAIFPEWGDRPHLGFECDFRGLVLFISDRDGNGDEDQVTSFLQAYLSRFDKKGKIGFEYAYTGRNVGDNGGGALVIKASGVCKFVNSGQWLAKELAKR